MMEKQGKEGETMSSISDFIIENGKLREYIGPGGDIVIPEGVTEIDPSAFKRCKTSPVVMRSVVIPEGVTSLKGGTFRECSELVRVTLPESLVEIGGDSYFDACFGACFDLKKINLPAGLKKIGAYAFRFTELTEAVIPSGVTEIGTGAFLNCRELTKISLPEGLYAIKEELFKECRNLRRVEIPSSVRTIGGEAFYDCGNLSEVLLPEGLESIGAGAFCGCESLKELRFPSTLRRIDDGYETRRHFESVWVGAFTETHIKGINLPKQFEQLGSYSFARCPEIKTVTLPEGLQTVHSNAFERCENLEEVILPEKMKRIDSNVFYKCDALKKLKIGYRRGEKTGTKYLAYADRSDGSNLDGFGRTGFWDKYDLGLIDNEPYKFKLPMRLLGMVGRLMDPVKLSDENRFLMTELLTKNAKKLIALAEELNEPDIIPVLFENGIINKENQKALVGLIKASANPQIAACQSAEVHEKSGKPETVSQRKAPVKLSDKKKVELLEKEVLNNNIQEAVRIVTEYRPEFTARALGLACRFSGAEMVRLLLTAGASFQFSPTPELKRKYGCMIKVSNDRDIPMDYSRYLLSGFPVNGYSNQVLPDEERAEVLKILVQKNAADRQELLYHAILHGDTIIIETLKELGTHSLSEFRRSIVDGAVLYNYYSSEERYRKDIFIQTCNSEDDMELLVMMKRFLSCIPPKRIYLGSNQLYGFRGFNTRYCSPILFSFYLEHTNIQEKVSKKELLHALIEQNNAEGMEYVLEAGWVSKPKDLSDLLAVAQRKENVHPGILASILKRMSGENEEEKNSLKEFSLDGTVRAPSLREIWGTKKQEDGSLMITSYKGNGEEENVIVPERIGRTEVRAIAAGAFNAAGAKTEEQRRSRAAIRSVEFPGSIREVPPSMFYSTAQIRRVVLNEGTESIGEYAFEGSSVEEVVIPGSVTEFGRYSFFKCKNLKEIRIPAGVRKLPAWMFAYSGLEKIVIPKSVKRIEEYAFKGCKNLQSIFVPNDISVKQGAFAGCSALADDEGRIVASNMLLGFETEYQKDRLDEFLMKPLVLDETIHTVAADLKGLPEIVIRKRENRGETICIAALKTGDEIEFGQFPTGTDFIPKPLKWKVLTVEDGRALLITVDEIMTVMRGFQWRGAWANSRIRNMLNDVFLEIAFSDREREQIKLVTLATPSSNDSREAESNKTMDRVFLLSPPEAEKYFPNDESRKSKKTDYARAQSGDRRNHLWKLRTASEEWDYIICVDDTSGRLTYVRLNNGNSDAKPDEYSLRPAIWVR